MFVHHRHACLANTQKCRCSGNGYAYDTETQHPVCVQLQKEWANEMITGLSLAVLDALNLTDEEIRHCPRLVFDERDLSVVIFTLHIRNKALERRIATLELAKETSNGL